MASSSSLPATFVPGFHDPVTISRMPYRQFGDRLVSALSLGCSAFGGVFHGVDEDECVRVVHTALKAGVNVLDTAPWYGHGTSELVLGKALVGIPRQAYYLHTKVGRYRPEPLEMFDFSYARTIASVNESLARLGLDYIDTVQVHDPEFSPSIDIVLNETLPALEALRAAGKIRYIGITGYPLEVLRTLAERSHTPVHTAISYCHYNLHTQTLVTSGTAALLASKGIAIINASPLSMGLLTQRGPPTWHPSKAALKARCAEAAAWAAAQGVDIAHCALVFCLEAPEPIATTMISTSSTKRLQDDIDATTGAKPLTEHERTVMKEVIRKFFAEDIDSFRTWEGSEVQSYWVKYGQAVANTWYASLPKTERAPSTAAPADMLGQSAKAAAESQMATAASSIARTAL